MAGIDTTALVAEVTRYDTLEASVEALLAGQAQAIKDAVTAAVTKAVADTQAADQAQTDAIVLAAQSAVDSATTSFKADNDKLAAAVVANTPAAPTA